MPNKKEKLSARSANTQRESSEIPVTVSYTELPLVIQKLNAEGTKHNKFGNQKTEVDGIKFASRHEANRYIELKYMERAHLISGLQLQKVFTLIGEQRDEKGRILERPVKYIADFVYKDHNGKTVVEDAKGLKTDVYKIKRKLMLMIYGIQIQEV